MSRTRLIITIVVIVLLIAVIVLALISIFGARKKDSNENIVLPVVEENYVTQKLPTAEPNVNNVQVVAPVAKELTAEEKERSFLIKTAAAFAERFGSYSNQSNYENLLDVKTLMTQKMQSWIDSLVASKKQGPLPTVYYGITTRALNTNIQNLENSKVEIVVSTQRQESVGAEANSRVYYQDLQIVFSKDSGVWQIDEARWQ